MATTSRDVNTGQIQQQVTGAASDAKLSRTEMNVLKTMIAVIACFLLCWSAADVADFLQHTGVSMNIHMTKMKILITICEFYEQKMARLSVITSYTYRKY